MIKTPKDIAASTKVSKKSAEFDWYAAAYQRFSIAERKNNNLERDNTSQFVSTRINMSIKSKSGASKSA